MLPIIVSQAASNEGDFPMWPTLNTFGLTLSRMAARKAPPRRRPAFHRPLLEALEDRCVPTAGVLDPTFGNDPVFGPGIVRTAVGAVDDEATHVFVQANGELRVVGLTQLGDLTHPGDWALTISLYKADGSPDTTFNSAGPVPATVVTDLTSPNYGDLLLSGIEAPVFGPDGSFVILQDLGYDASRHAAIRQLVRFDQNGSRDTAFNTNAAAAIGGFSANAIAVQPDGKVLIAGSVNLQETPWPITDTVLERLNTDGSLDPSFNSAGPVPGKLVLDLGLHEELTIGPGAAGDISDAHALAVQPDGAILVGGNVYDESWGDYPGFVARFTSTGSLDSSFGDGGDVLLVNTGDWHSDLLSLRFGRSVEVFRETGSDPADVSSVDIYNITLQADGKMLVYDASSQNWIRLNQSGTVDTGFAQDAYGETGIRYPWGTPVPDESGRFFFGLNRYNPDGSPDLTFGPDGYGFGVLDDLFGWAWNTPGLAVQSDGKIVGVGYVSTDDGQTWQALVVRFQSEDQLHLAFSPATVQQQLATTVSFLQNSSTDSNLSPIVLAADPATVDSVLNAVNALPEPPSGTTPRQVNVVVNLSAGSYSDVTASLPLGVTLVINGNGSSTTIEGHSPALALASGTVLVQNVTLTTATDAPTILVTGGHLTLRNDIIQESTGFNDAAISITGGTVDLGTASDPGGNTLNVNGAGTFLHDTSSNPIAAVGDVFTVNGTAIAPSILSGLVWEDFNDDGQVDFGEKDISCVTITLTGTDFLGNPVNLSQLTDGDGAYVFLNLWPGTYYLTETQPTGYLQGHNSVGTAGGSLPATDQFFVQLGQGVNGLNYNFGERPMSTGSVQQGQTAGIGFWNNKNGQALIKRLNGGTGTHLADWLAATLPNMFGLYAGSNNLTGRSNGYVAALFQQDFVLKGGEGGRPGAGDRAVGLRHQRHARLHAGGGPVRLHGQRRWRRHGDGQRRQQWRCFRRGRQHHHERPRPAAGNRCPGGQRRAVQRQYHQAQPRQQRLQRRQPGGKHRLTLFAGDERWSLHSPARSPATPSAKGMRLTPLLAAECGSGLVESPRRGSSIHAGRREDGPRRSEAMPGGAGRGGRPADGPGWQGKWLDQSGRCHGGRSPPFARAAAGPLLDRPRPPGSAPGCPGRRGDQPGPEEAIPDQATQERTRAQPRQRRSRRPRIPRGGGNSR
jgi:uncharacterized delta-60 repeat protein